MKTSKKYTRELRRQFGYLATWLPSTPLELGDIGILKQNVFTKISNLSDFGIEFEIESDDTKSDIEHSSVGAVSITSKASGSTSLEGSNLAEGDAGISVQFSKEKAILFKANGTTSPSIKNQIQLGIEIIELYQEGKWDKDWVVVTELVNADSATILISSSANSKIDLKASGALAASKLDIADAKLGLEVSFSKDLSTKIIAAESLTPLFKVSKIKSRPFASPSFSMPKTRSVLFNTRSIASMDLMTPELSKQIDNALYFSEAEFETELGEEFA